jgi:hypothetical protein
MMIAKSNSNMPELPKRWRVLFIHKIRAHPVPDDNHDVALRLCGLRCGSEGKRNPQKQ